MGALGAALLILSIAALLVLVSALSGWLFMLAWNFVMPILWYQAPVLGFLDAWAAFFLLSLIGAAFRR